MTGFVVVNKKEGVSSAREVARVKRLTGLSCGHMGTLDPMATGVLPIAVGNATRLFDYFLNKRKRYVATFIFGEEYDTLDTTGILIKSDMRVPLQSDVDGIIPSLVGTVMQVPPAYSAKNVGGVRGYKLAREGKAFSLPPKRVDIYSIKRISFDGERSYTFEIECGGGTYIRSIARDMAERLGVYASMSGLVRTMSGPFRIEDSVCSDDLSADNVFNYLVPADKVITFEDIVVSESDGKKLFNGVPVKTEYNDGIYRLYAYDGMFYGLAEVSGGILKVRTKLC